MNDPFFYTKVWSWNGPTRIKFTLWKMSYGKLLTNEERVCRCIAADILCCRCNDALETIVHTLGDCEETNELCTRTLKEEHWSKFFSLGLFAWLDLNMLDWNLSSYDVGNIPLDWNTFLGVVVASPWKDSNRYIVCQTSEMGDKMLNSIHH